MIDDLNDVAISAHQVRHRESRTMDSIGSLEITIV
jgi:hypothetical protein